MASSGNVSLPVLSETRPGRTGPGSRMERRRFAVLLVIQGLIIVHVVQWLIMGRTIAPIEPSESIETIEKGVINAGFIFFVLAIGSTMIFGRYFCGWGCHVILLQDWCAKILGRVGIRPRPFRSRLLVWLPLGLACYMFVWPVAHRYLVAPWMGEIPAWPGWTVEVTTEDFWKTFPGFMMAIPFLFVCGFLTVYLLGMKGYCTYACPYGGFFAPAEQVAPMRIRVNDNCAHCGACTAACTSNVRIHEEVTTHGMVVDPGCMKCMDCVTVCPEDALYLGFGRPAIAKKVESKPKPKPRSDLSWTEEIVFASLALGILLSIRGFYGLPLLFAGGTAVCATWVLWKTYCTLRRENLSLHRIPLKRSGRMQFGGGALVSLSLVTIVLSAWLGTVNVAGQIAATRFRQIATPEDVVFGQGTFIEPGPETRRAAESAYEWYGRLDFVGAGGWSPLSPNRGRLDLIAVRRAWCLSVLGRFEEAFQSIEEVVARRGESENLALWQGVIVEVLRPMEADRFYGGILERHPDWMLLRDARILWRSGEMSLASAIAEARVGLEAMPDELLPIRRLAVLLSESDDPDAWLESRELTERTLEVAPNNEAAWRALSVVQTKLGRFDDAETSMQKAIELSPRNWRIITEYALLINDRQRRDEAEALLEKAVLAWASAGSEGPRPALPPPASSPMQP